MVKEATRHRAVLVLRGRDLSPMVTDVDPHERSIVQESRSLTPEAERTAKIVNDFVRMSSEVLERHPVNVRRSEMGGPKANILLPRGRGAPELRPFEERYKISGACIAGVSLIKGICRVCGMDSVIGATLLVPLGGWDRIWLPRRERQYIFLRPKSLFC